MHQMTAAGLQTDTLETIIDEVINEFHTRISAVADLSESTPMGSALRILCERERTVMDALEEVYAGQYPSTAFGFSLDLIAALTGCYRQEARPSTLLVTEADVLLNAGVTLTAGNVANVDGNPEARFVTVADVTNGGGAPAWIPCAFESEETGPIQCLNGTLGTITEPFAGWTDVRNTADATLGSDEELDAPYRLRRVIELAQGGSTTVLAIVAELSALFGMISVIVLENIYDWTNGDGLPPHSIEAIVYDGTDVADLVHNVEDGDLADALFGVVAGGIRTWGDELEDYVDDLGSHHPIRFTRATERDLYISIDISTDGDYDPQTYEGDAALAAALATWGAANLGLGDEVVYLQIAKVVMEQTGIADLTALTIGWAPAPVGVVNLAVAFDEIAIIDSGNVVVTS